MKATYTLTIKIAPIGTPLSDGKTSQTGHMWYEVSETKNHGAAKRIGSYGWAAEKIITNSDNFINNDNEKYIQDDKHLIITISLEINEL